MAQNSQSPTIVTNSHREPSPVRKITWKVLFYVAFALAWTTFFVFGIVITSPRQDWLWEGLCFAISIGGAIVSAVYTRQARVRRALAQAGTASGPTAAQRSISLLTTLYGMLALIAMAAFVVVMYNGHPLGKELFFSLVAGSGITWGFELANRESRDPVAAGPYRNRLGSFD